MIRGPADGDEPARPRSLADSLRAWDDRSLTALLEARPDLLRPIPKDISTLAARATSGPSTARCLDGLAALDLALLAVLVHGPTGTPMSQEWVRRSTQAAVQGHAIPASAGDASGLPEAIEASLERVRGLALVWGPPDDLRATNAVRDALGTPPRAQWPIPSLVIGGTVAGCNEEGGWRAIGFLARVRELLDEWGQRPPAVLRTQGLGVREFAAARLAMHADVPSSALAIELAHAAGLVASDEESSPCYVPTDAYDEWRELPPAQAWSALAQAWLRLPRLPGLVDERANLLSADQDRRAVIGMRQGVLRLLAEAGAHCPVQPASLRAVLDDRQPRLAGALRQQVIEATLLEATDLGIIASSALTDAGRALVDGSGSHVAAMARYLPTPIDHVLVQADLTIIAPGPLTPDLQRTLGCMAEIESTGHATVYRLSAASLGRAMEAGLDGPAIRARLAEIARSPLPATVEILIEDVARRHGGVRVGLAESYVRCLDPAIAATIAADRALGRLGLSLVDDHLLVASVPASSLLPALRAAGYPVAAETPDGSVLLPRQVERRIPHRTDRVQVRKASAGTIQAAVRGLRAAQSAAEQAGQPPASTESGPDTPIEVDHDRRCTGPAALALLRAAIADAQPVWMAYAESDGVTSEQLLDPIRVGSGTVTAFDHRVGQVRTLTLARIASVAPVVSAG